MRGVLTVARTLVRQHYLVGQLSRRVFFQRHAGSILGWGWSLVSTAVQFAILLVVFSKIAGIKLAGPHPVGFGVYLICGLVPFLMLQESVLGGAGVFHGHPELVQRMRVPLEVLVVSETVGRLLHQALAFVVVVAVCLGMGVIRPTLLGWTALGLVLLVVWCLGLALLMSTMGAILRDVEEVLGLVLQVVFYATPIVYPLSLVTDAAPRLAGLVRANPMTLLVDLVRAGLIGTAPPGAVAVAALAVGGVLVVVIGAALLDRVRGKVADLL